MGNDKQRRKKRNYRLYCLVAGSENVVCLSRLLHIFANLITNLQANSVDSDQVAPTGAI